MHERVVVRGAAVAAAQDQLPLTFSRRRLGDASLTPPEDTGTLNQTLAVLGDRETLTVPVVTLDEEFPVDLPVRLLKVDVEGFEHHVLDGARRLLDQHCIDVVMLECVREVYGTAWPQFRAALTHLVERGYVPATLNRRGRLGRTTLPDALDRDEGRNVFFLSPYAVDELL